jgi:NAD(P)H dehydrogenase (quinone)
MHVKKYYYQKNMSIGIIVYSGTGNTLSVAEKLKVKLSANNHSVELKRIEIVGEYDPRRPIEKIEFKEIYDINKYDAVIFGSPVQAFSLSPVMKQYMPQVKGLKGQKVAFLITEAFPFAFLGGNQAVSWLTKHCEKEGAEVLGSEVVTWRRPTREKQIEKVVEKFNKLI